MREFLDRFPYFGTSLLVTILCLVGIVLFRRHRKTTLLSAVAAIPWGIWALFLVPEYRNPRNLVRLGRLGIEDFLWAFGTGGLTWLAGVVLSGCQVSFHWDAVQSSRRLLVASAIGFAVFLPLFLGGVQGMVAFAASVVCLGAILVFIRPGNWRLALAGGIGFGFINFLVTETAVLFCPEYFQQMTPSGLNGRMLLNLPVEEVYWAFATGATWPLLIHYAFANDSNSRESAVCQDDSQA